jgi:hypothetical protein
MSSTRSQFQTVTGIPQPMSLLIGVMSSRTRNKNQNWNTTDDHVQTKGKKYLNKTHQNQL